MIIRLFRFIVRLTRQGSGPARLWGTWPDSSGAKPREVPALQTGEVIWVIDGDTVVVRLDGRETRIRLASIDCPEDGQEWGDIAKFGLMRMIARKSVTVEPHGYDVYGRLVATLYVYDRRKGQTVNVNERMIILGHAWVLRDFLGHLPIGRQDALTSMENWARTRRVGLWSRPNPIPPWEWRGEV